jgi:hypothetical protein
MCYRRGLRVFIEHEDGDELFRVLIARVGGPEANAHLIAAAPDMLEALKVALAHISGDPFGTSHNTILAAISKAEGKNG